MSKDRDATKHEWDPQVLEPALVKARTRLRIALVVAVPTLIVGVFGLVIGGTGPIWGLAALAVCAFSASFALRNKTKMDYCARQLDRIARGKTR